jgi:hypothetical protein
LDSKYFSLRKPSERTKSSQEKNRHTTKGIKHIKKQTTTTTENNIQKKINRKTKKSQSKS